MMTLAGNVLGKADPDSRVMTTAYSWWAPIYDQVCGPILAPGRRAATAAARNAGHDILEIGVGTGLSLAEYDSSHAVVGIDFNATMIQKAKARFAEGAYPNVRALQVMDAHVLGFPDRTFDCVVAQFLITLVERPEIVLDECARVLRPGGEIILVNHFYSEQGFLAALERSTTKIARRVGLRPDFPFGRLSQWAAEKSDIDIVERRPLKPFGAYTLVRFRKRSVASQAA
jgi:phosphatidylethanolamine/phosphatidyl-N-methylethanolamine N-methyltransferase